MTDLLVGRQPIFNRRMEVVAYELLYRSLSQPNSANVVDQDQATMQVILNTFSEIGLDTIVGEARAFINLTRNFLLGKFPLPFPPDRVVLEVLENIGDHDESLRRSLKSLISSGYWLALDDVCSVQQVTALLGLARIIKIDLLQVQRTALPELVAAFKAYPVQLLAEKVETQEDFNLCTQLGFTYFQGYFLCKPSIVKGRRMDTSRLVVLRSLAKLQDPQASFESLEEIIALDVNLGYKLIKLVNSGYYSLATQVSSIRQAISLIGLNQLRGWVTLLLMNSINNKPHELTVIALQRARMCELFARAKGLKQPETYFLVGLLSVLDALMDTPMAQIVSSLPLSPEVTEALLNRRGSPGEILEAVTAYEQGNWDGVLKIHLDGPTIQGIYLDALHWTNLLMRDVET